MPRRLILASAAGAVLAAREDALLLHRELRRRLIRVRRRHALLRELGDDRSRAATRGTRIGDTVVLVTAYELQGVVEDVSLRHTRLRALNGEVIHVNNGAVSAARVLPRGVKELAIELFVNERAAGERLVRDIVAILPEGPTTFIRRPTIEQVDELAHNLTRLRVRATVAPGREWLAEGFFSDLLRQRATDGLIVHGPVALAVDDRATWSYARASAASRASFGQAAAGAPAGAA